MKFLNIDFRPGFIVYRNGPGPVWVCPHSGPAVEIPTSRDQWSETIASLCWLKMGGTLIVSTIPRKQMYGMDFNREIPPKDSSLNLWPQFVKDENKERLEKYRKVYSWTAVDEADHKHRLKIYNDFWNTVRRAGNIIVFLHTQFTRIKNFPSVMDVITYRGRGVKNEIIKAMVKKTNEKYEQFFRHIEKPYKDEIYLEQQRVIDRIKEVFSEFNPDKMKVEYKTNILSDLDIIKKYANRKVYRRLQKEFNEKNFLSALKSALKQKIHPHITVESIFKGQKALTMKKPLFREGNIVMEVETTRFLGNWYPRRASEIVMEILKDMVSVEMYRKMGFKQTQIVKFLKKEI
ncbi:MAG: hypothetical protein KAT94_04155 [Candidatus Aenigmarchaeota archaeon]|nr:hypothetical protein [Candidatus Aenigmarchaeota archaeon]